MVCNNKPDQHPKKFLPKLPIQILIGNFFCQKFWLKILLGKMFLHLTFHDLCNQIKIHSDTFNDHFLRFC